MHSSSESGEQTDPENSTEWPSVERRSSDRRDSPTPLLSRRPTPARREGGRRHSDHSSYVDRYTKRDVALLMTIFLLNVADAFFTMSWLDRGGREANPVMDFFLDIGPTAFLAQKCLVVGAWLLILLAHKNFRFARIGLYASLVVYGALILLHFGILAFGIEPPKPADQTDSATPQSIEKSLGDLALAPERNDSAVIVAQPVKNGSGGL